MKLRDYVRGMLGPIRTAMAQLAQRQRIVGRGLVCTRTTPVSVSANTTVAVSWDAAAIDDFSILPTHPTFTAPHAGRVRITAQVPLYATSITSGTGVIALGVRHISGASTVDTPLSIYTIDTADRVYTHTLTSVIDVSVGDEIYVTITMPAGIDMVSPLDVSPMASFVYTT